MEEEEGGGIRLSKRFSDKGGEVDYKTKAGTAWSHSYLNQKPWHPLSYPNQRRKWIAEQTHNQRERRAEEVAREYAQEQEFFRQTALVSKKEKEKMEMMKAVGFMYVRPPGYNAESAKAADMADERKKQEPELESTSHAPSENGASMLMKPEAVPSAEEKRKPRPKDVFGRAVPTEEQFEVLKNAPRLETGVAARSKPFGVEIRNVKCLRCGNYGHQSGDRECPLKDAIMPSEESRLKRDDPLTAILSQTEFSEPLKWELKQKPGLSPPRGGFRADDPNQQIVAEDIFDEYGGFLGGDDIPELLTNFYSSNPKKKSRKRKHKRNLSSSSNEVNDQEKGSTFSDDGDRRSKKKVERRLTRKHLHSSLRENSDFDKQYDGKDNRSSAGGDRGNRLKKKRDDKMSRRLSGSRSQDSGMLYGSEDNRSSSGDHRERRSSIKKKHKRKSRQHAYSIQSDSNYDKHRKSSSDDDRERRSSNREREKRKLRKRSYSSESDYFDYDGISRRKRS